jgi:hypothetical protein
MVAASDRIAVAFQLSAGRCHDAPMGRMLLGYPNLEKLLDQGNLFMAMDRGYEYD